MKKILIAVVYGLMSLLTFSSCEDKFILDDENNFLPFGYNAKDPEEDDERATSSTLLIVGLHNLVFDEIEKSDWRIITQSVLAFRGNQPLTLNEERFEVTDTWSQITNIPTNYGDIPVTFGNITVNYQYMGDNIELQPIDGLTLNVRVEEDEQITEPIFMQHGKVVFCLRVGYCPVKFHEVRFLVIEDKDKQENYTVEEWKDGDAVSINLE